MKFQVILFFICDIEISSQLTGNVCVRKRYEYCCANNENVNGICIQCRHGTYTYAGDRCVSCKYDTYGYKCHDKCVCGQFQRCDPELGCVPKTSISSIHTAYTGATAPVILLNETGTTRETHVVRIETSMVVWVVVTLSIFSCFVLPGVGYLIHAHIQRFSCKFRIINEEVILEPIEPSSYGVVYDEVDQNPSRFDTADLNVTSLEPHYETIDCVPQERLSITTISEHDDTGYLDAYFAKEEDENHQCQARTCSSTNSYESYVVDQDSTECINLYQALQDNWQANSHGYEIPVMVHEGFECFAGFDDNIASNSYYNVYKTLQKDGDVTNPTYENQKSLETKAGNDTRLFGETSSSVIKTDNLQDYINTNAEFDISMNNCDKMESCKPFAINEEDNVKKLE